MMCRQGWLFCLLLIAGPIRAAELAVSTCADRQAAQMSLQASVSAAVQRLAGQSLRVSLGVIRELPVIVQARVSLLSNTLRSRMAVSITGRSCDLDRQVAETLWLMVKATREAWVFGRNAAQDSAISEAAPRREVIDIAALQLADSELADSIEDQWLRQPVFAGRPVLKRQLKSAALVRRDQQVTVRVRGPGLELRTQGRALQSGMLGDAIAVLVSGAEISMPAVVVGKGEVHVDVDM